MVKPSEYRLKLDANGRAKELEEKYFFNTETDDRDEDDYVYNRDGHVTSYEVEVNRTDGYSTILVITYAEN